MLQNVVVGSGIGGSLIASLLQNDNLILFEQDHNLGGCASTFKRFGKYFNTGATTFVGYEKDHVVQNIFQQSNITPDIKKSDIAIRVIHKNKHLDRIKDFDQFLEQLQQFSPHPKHKEFWSKLKQIDEKFWKLQKVYFGKYRLKRYFKTSLFVIELLQTFGKDIFLSAEQFIEECYGDISLEYQDFIDASLLITIQSTSKNISLLSLALGLCYPFHDVFYPNGGMGKLLEEITKEVDVHLKEKVEKIIPMKGRYKILTNRYEYDTKNVILNSTVFDSEKLFDDPKIKKYYQSFSFNDQSAFVVYLYIQSKESFLHHYQILLEHFIPNCISKSFFVSISDQNDPIFNKHGGYSITISTHTKALFWKNLTQEQYQIQKNKTQTYIVEKFLEYFDTISKDDIVECFSATSITFERYIGRKNCGGKTIGFHNILELPSAQTPFDGLYNVGDTVFAGQGWPGVALGVNILYKELHG